MFQRGKFAASLQVSKPEDKDQIPSCRGFFFSFRCCCLLRFDVFSGDKSDVVSFFFFPEFVMEQMKREEGGAQGWLLTSENLK